jgi:hypothetical protein
VGAEFTFATTIADTKASLKLVEGISALTHGFIYLGFVNLVANTNDQNRIPRLGFYFASMRTIVN